jgi:hypothetical protein
MLTGPMISTLYHDRRAFQIENASLRVTALAEGGHIAGLLYKPTGVNPLWQPPWPSIEPSAWSPDKYPIYGNDSESKLLAGIMGHNLCLDIFGPPSGDEARAGMVAHGEAGVLPWQFESIPNGLRCRCVLPNSQLAFERTIVLDDLRALIHETVENLANLDRPIAWTQHVTLGPPFLNPGITQFRVTATKSRAIGETTDHNWPELVPSATPSAYAAHLMDPSRDDASFTAWTPNSLVALSYVWKRADFPWLGIWEENKSRAQTPWLSQTQTCGMEFGVSPFPEPRRKMIDRGPLFNTPTFRWIGARQTLSADYYAILTPAKTMPETPFS